MAQTIKLKRNSENNDTAPVAGDLEVGEIAVNSVSGKLYTKKSDENGTVVEISGSGGASSGGGGGTPELTFTVTVAEVSGADKYHLAGATSGFASATAAPTVDLQRGFTYKFDQSDSSNATHPLIITTSSTGGTTATAYTTGVTTTGTLGVDRVLTFVVPHSAADTMYYQCSAHTGLGAELDVGDTIVAGATNLPIYDEDELLASSISKLNFTGTGVTATYEVESVTTPGDADWAKVTALISGGETVATSSGGGISGHSTMASDLALYYAFENNLTDSTGNLNATSSGTTSFTNTSGDYKVGTHGLSVAQGHAEIANNSHWDFAGNDWSISMWYKASSFQNYGVIFGKGHNNQSGWVEPYGLIWIRQDPTNQGGLECWTNGNSSRFFTTGGNSTDTWYHLVLVHTSTNNKVYLNNSLDVTSTSGSGSTPASNSTISLGRNPWNTSEYITGFIDEVGLFNKALTTTEISDLYNSGNGLAYGSITSYSFPDSSASHTVTIKGGQTALDTTTVPAVNGSKPTGITYGGAMKFDGTDDYYTIPSDADFAFGAVDSTDNDFTIESWVYLASDVAGDCVLFDGRTTAANAVVPLLEVKSNKLTYTVNGVALITDSADLTTNTWHHIAIIRSGANTVVSKNGTTIGGTQTASTYVACPWTIGASSASSATAFFKGWMEEWRVTKGKTRYTVTTGTSAAGDASGGTETVDGSHAVHTFTTSGTFTIATNDITDIEYLVIAGGGGGGGYKSGGGGGAGGYLSNFGGTKITAAVGDVTVTIGAGGAGGLASSPYHGSEGSDSSVAFSSGTITTTGGGGAGSQYAEYGRAGGSGGGGGGSGGAGGDGNTPSTTPAQGFDGARCQSWAAGGGGGSSEEGYQTTGSVGGSGGDGTSNAISGTATTYAGCLLYTSDAADE